MEREAAATATASAPATVVSSGGASSSGPVSTGATSTGMTSKDTANKSSLSFKIGIADFTPFGFMDFTTIYRNRTAGGGGGTNFGGFPFQNSNLGQLSETRFTAQNSRLGLRVDSTVQDAKVMGYVETDFLGNAAGNLNVTSNSATLRMRLYFADIRKNEWEFLAGQSWSMLTPNRKGISPLPSDIFYTQVVDFNYTSGLTWTRQPQIRAVYHASNELTLGLSAESSDQYVGGGVVLPAGFSASQVDTGAASNSANATPNSVPDFIGKVAFDTKIADLPYHFELAGLYRNFEINTIASGVSTNVSKAGYGVSGGLVVGVLPNLNVVASGFLSKGGGRYIGNTSAPDFVVRSPDASGNFGIKTVQASSAIVGLEWAAIPSTNLYAYYSIVDIGKSYDNNTGPFVGYGFTGSASSNNHMIDEYTVGASHTLWKNPTYGALQLLLQLSYLDRKPWFVAPNAPSKANLGMAFFDIRYTLP